MKKYLVLIATLTTMGFTTSAFAESGEPTCISSGTKLSKAAIKAKATDMGYNVRQVKTENGCFEVKAIAKDGSRVDVFMDPNTGKVMKIEKKS